MNSRKPPSTPRTGALYIEAVITSMMLITVLVSIAKYARHSHQLDRLADRRLARELACENAWGRIVALSQHHSDTATVRESLPEIVRQIENACGVKLSIAIHPFDPSTGLRLMNVSDNDPVRGLQVAMEPVSQTSSTSFFRMDRWILKPFSSERSPSEDRQAQDSENRSNGGSEDPGRDEALAREDGESQS